MNVCYGLRCKYGYSVECATLPLSDEIESVQGQKFSRYVPEDITTCCQ